jgi:oligosaccharide repeat unit polymerase
MISLHSADAVILTSLFVQLLAYWLVARRERSFLNILTPAYVIDIPASYILPAAYAHLFGTEGSPFAFAYVYATMAVQPLVFALVYIKHSKKKVRLPFGFAHRNFASLAFVFLVLAFFLYLPILLEFPEFLLNPREIYSHTRVGYGLTFFASSMLAYISMVFALFSELSWWRKHALLAAALVVLLLHGSKGEILAAFFFYVLYEIYARGRKVTLLYAAAAIFAVGILVLGLFAATLNFSGASEALENIAQYSTYTQNAMLVIDEKFPRQYGQLTLQDNLYALIPRAMFPGKPKTLGELRLADEYYPRALDEEKGAPAFGIGVQYADFGVLAIIYLALFGALRGWLARVFVDRLHQTKHPGDFVMVAFLGGVSIFPVGTGWLFPEALCVVFLIRFLSTLGKGPVYREIIKSKPPASYQLEGPTISPA